MNQLIEFSGQAIRMAGTAEKPEWIAADVCRVLAINNASDTIRKFAANERGIVTIDTLQSGYQQMLTVTEPGLYRLIFKSRKPEAERFRQFITHEVLPSIRKFGCYPAPDVAISTGALVNIDFERFERNLSNAIGVAVGCHVGPIQQDVAELKVDVRDIKHDLSRIAKRKPITLETRRIFVRVLAASFHGVCPCCSRKKILASNTQTNDFAQVDHWRLPSQNDLRWTWIVCITCNQNLRDADFHDAHEPRFRAFQEAVSHFLQVMQPRLFQ